MPDHPHQDDEPCTAGWDAITAALERLYPNQEPRHWGSVLSFRIGGEDPLDGISVYLHDDGTGSSPHWHFVSFGMSELYDKESDDKTTSGWGFELTFRLRKSPSDGDPPAWPLSLMQNLARYVFQTGNLFGPGHYFPLNGPIALGEQTELHAAMFVEDPELGAIDTPNGRLQFLQLVGTTLDELAAAQAWDTEKFLAMMAVTNPLLVTDLARRSILGDPNTARKVEESTAREGSSSGSLAVRELQIVSPPATEPDAKSLTIVLGASGVSDVQSLLRSRTGFGRTFLISGPKAVVVIVPAEQFAWQRVDADDHVKVELPASAARSLAAILQSRRGEYRTPDLPDLTIRVVPSEIKDHTGTHVVRVIG
jgi:hypothetical protein